MNNFINLKKSKNKNFFIKKNLININKLKTNKINYGIFGLKSIESKLIHSIHFKLLSKFLIKCLKKKGKFWFKVYPFFSKTKKGDGIRMGGGKGKIDDWYFFLTKGQIFLEIESSLSFEKIKKIFKIINSKLSLKFKLICLKIDNLFFF